MVDKSQLKVVIDELEVSQVRLWEIVGGAGPNWRLELVQARRELALALGHFSSRLHCEEVFQSLSISDQDAIRNRLTSYRSALAMHQATFPAVSINGAHDRSYIESASTVRSAASELFTFVRQLFGLR